MVKKRKVVDHRLNRHYDHILEQKDRGQSERC